MKETGLYCSIESILVGLALVLKPSQDPERQSNEVSARLLSILTVYVSDCEVLLHSRSTSIFSSVGFYCIAVFPCANPCSLDNYQIFHRKWVFQCKKKSLHKDSLPVVAGAAGDWCLRDSFVRVTKLWTGNCWILNWCFLFLKAVEISRSISR